MIELYLSYPAVRSRSGMPKARIVTHFDDLLGWTENDPQRAVRGVIQLFLDALDRLAEGHHGRSMLSSHEVVDYVLSTGEHCFDPSDPDGPDPFEYLFVDGQWASMVRRQVRPGVDCGRLDAVSGSASK